ncbi:SYT1 [Lepeophtheirus salmonis]|uniref:SYT1 n=1 Tax=Lepeophtheirus salmonis TaxID=72036 RepID=A0A7R8CVH7_LEPSM|nr:SYT1 [Lepeophtheirus salmonis]CAF2912237.1 SYT1 [Lepeophtheirus salmonis]
MPPSKRENETLSSTSASNRSSTGTDDTGITPVPEETFLEKANDKVIELANSTGLKQWHVIVIISVVTLSLLLCFGWCIWRFFKKKRPRDKKKKDGKLEGDDEDYLVDNEEEVDIKDEPDKMRDSKEYLGKLQYKLEYDFNTQTLNVTAIQCSELPALDMENLRQRFTERHSILSLTKPLPSKMFLIARLLTKFLFFAVFDYDRFSKHDQIGEVKVPLCMVDLAQTIEEWKDLCSVKVDDQYLGDICFSLRYVPTSGKLTVGILECKNLKKMDITGASDPYVKIKLLDRKGKRIGKKKKTSVKMGNLNPYYNESFVFIVEQEQLRRVNLELTVSDYDRIGTSDPIGRVILGYNRKGAEIKHWREMVENPRRPVIHWHVLQDPEPGEDDDDEKKKDSKKAKDGSKKEGTGSGNGANPGSGNGTTK